MNKKPISLLTILVFLELCSFVLAEKIRESFTLCNSKLLNLDGGEITDPNLKNIMVGEQLEIKIHFFDECEDNLTDISINELEIVFEPEIKNREETRSFNYNISQSDGEFTIDLNSTLAGKFKFTGNYFQKKVYYVTFIPGEASLKSILEVDKTVINLGDTVTVYIIPYDEYENLIDANTYKINNDNPFIVSYNNVTANADIFAQNYGIVNILKYSLISYEIQLLEEGEILIKGEIGGKILNNRTVTVKLAEIDFRRSEVFRYNSRINDFEVLKNDSNIENYENNSIYRLYLKDINGKEIKYLKNEQLNDFKAYLNFNRTRYVFYNFKLNNTERRYAEYIIYDVKNQNKIFYNDLVYGEYDLVFVYGSEKLLYNIILDNGCSFSKPFRCSVNKTIQCVTSQTDCDCPDYYYKCDFTHCCVPENRTDMCSNVEIPNQKVCPIGKVLCADLSCRDSYTDCFKEFGYCYHPSTKRCPDQTCAITINYCPKTIDCGNSSKYVCNDDKCVESELECVESAVCDSGENTYLCNDNTCKENRGKCPTKKYCIRGLDYSISLCADNKCRENCS